MSNTPPIEPTNAAGDGVELTPTQARSGQRTGRMIWILGISMGAIILIFVIFLVGNASHLQRISHSAGRDLNQHDVNSYQTPGGSARQDPSGQIGNTGN